MLCGQEGFSQTTIASVTSVFIECFFGAEPHAQHCFCMNALDSYPPVRQVPASSPLVRWKQEAREGGVAGCRLRSWTQRVRDTQQKVGRVTAQQICFCPGNQTLRGVAST